MAYRDDISALGADHHLDFDGDSLDQIGSVNGIDSSVIYTDIAIAEDASNCMTVNALTDRVSLPTTIEINNSAQARKAVCGFFATTAFQAPPTRIYGEGNQNTVFQFVLALGNKVILEIIEPTNFSVQLFGPILRPNRVYHLCGIFEGNGFANEVRFYVDGVKMIESEPVNPAPNTASLDARDIAIFGDPTGTVGVGAGVILLQAARNGQYNHWVTWGDEADAVLTDIEIREELFEKGVLPDITITAGIESVMQTNLDTYNTTERVDAPLCIRVPPNTGDTNFELTADGITYDSLSSIHVQYTGTATLTWRNDRDSNATIFSTTNGGTVIVRNETFLTITNLIAGSEIRVYEAGTTNELGGIENSSTSFTIYVYNDLVDIRIASLIYEMKEIYAQDTSVNLSIQITQFIDRVYTNP